MLFTWYLIFSVWKGKGDLQVCLGQNSKTGGPKSLQELYHLWEEVWRQEGNWRHHCQQEEIPVWRGSEGMYYKYSLGSPYIQLLLKLHECLLIWRLMSFMLLLILSPRKYQENAVLFGDRIPSMGEKTILVFTAFLFLHSHVDCGAQFFYCTQSSVPFTVILGDDAVQLVTYFFTSVMQ